MLGLNALPSDAQVATGSIVGKVVDAAGYGLPDATVTITNQATLKGAIVKSDSTGTYKSPPLNSGLYSIEAAKAHFGPVAQKDFELSDQQRAELNFTLRVGEVSQEVSVQADAPQLNTFNATLGTVLDNATAEELPSNGSGTLALVQLDSSVISANGPVNDGFYDRGLGVSNIRIGGGAAGANAQLMDGANNLQNVRGEVLINSTVTGIQSNRTAYGIVSSQYGLTSGGVITTTTRAGTSNLHGQAYEFYKNGALNAANHFAAKGTRPVQNYNQYGFALGGPLKKDRIFFFGNYETYGLNQVTPVTITVPTALERTGDFSDQPTSIYDPNTVCPSACTVRAQFMNNAIPAGSIDPAALAFTQDFIPAPNTGSPTTLVNNYISNAPLLSSQVITLGRIDWQVSNRNTLFARYAYYQNFNNNEGNYGALNIIASTRNDTQTSQDLNFGLTQVLSATLLNDIRVAVGRSIIATVPGSQGGNWPQQLGISNLPQTTLPQITISGYGIQVSTNTGARASTDPEISDTLTLLRGKHSVHTGAGFRFNESYINSNSAPSGQYSFTTSATAQLGSSSTTTGNAFASFLDGKAGSLIASLSAPSVQRALAIDGFVEDDWRATSRLTLNLGIRYDYQSIPWEKANGFSTLRLQPNPTTGLIGTEVYAGVKGQQSNFVSENYKNFGPRIGFAYLLTQKHQTVVRGGYAMYFANTFNQVYGNATDEFGTNVTSYSTTTNNGYVSQFSSGLPSATLPILGSSAGPNALLGQIATYQSPTAATPTSQQFVLAVDHQFPANTVVHLGFIQNHGTHFPEVAQNLNQLDPRYFSLGDTFLNASSTNPYSAVLSTLSPKPSLAATTLTNAFLLRPYPYFQGVYNYFPHIGRFMGRTGQLSIQRPINKNLQITMSYSLSQFLSDPLVSSITQSGISSPLQNSYAPHSEYGADPTDVRHRLSGNFVYNLPVGNGQTYFAGASKRLNRFIGGWGVSGIVSAQSGYPLAITGSNGYAANRPDYAPGVSLKVAHPSATGWFNTGAFVIAGCKPTTTTNTSGVTTTTTCAYTSPEYSFGNVPRTETEVRGPGNFTLNLNLTKLVRFSRYTVNLQVSAFNALNKTNYSTPSTAFSTTSSSFGTITSAQAARTLQLTSRIQF